MISLIQYWRLSKIINEWKTIQDAATAKAGIDPKTARKYLKNDGPTQVTSHNWRIKKDDLEDVWTEITSMLTAQPRLKSKTIFSFLIIKISRPISRGTIKDASKTSEAMERSP